MVGALESYKELFERFLSGRMPVEDFQATYLGRFKSEGPLEESLYQLLDRLFGDVDSYTADPKLLADNPNFYLDEAALRRRVREAALHLSKLHS